MLKLDRIDDLCREKGWSKRTLERTAGIAVGSISHWKEVTPSTVNLQKVADALGVSAAFLTGESDFRNQQDAFNAWNRKAGSVTDELKRIEEGIRIPVLGSVPCGIPVEAIEFFDANDWEDLSPDMAKTGKFFALRVSGDSMTPRICEGDVLIVKVQEDAESGDIVIAKVDGCDSCCKKLIKQDSGILLQSFNHAYDPMFFPNGEGVKIIGKVVENRQKF